MARTALTPKVLTWQKVGTITPGSQDFTLAASDIVNGNDFPHTGRELLIVKNDDAAAATVTIAGKADAYGRTGSVTAYSLDAGELGVFGPFNPEVFKQTDGKVWVDGSDADVKLAVLQLPA